MSLSRNVTGREFQRHTYRPHSGAFLSHYGRGILTPPCKLTVLPLVEHKINDRVFLADSSVYACTSSASNGVDEHSSAGNCVIDA